MEPVRLLVVEDSATLAEALLFAFSFEKDIESVGVAPTIGQAVDMVMAQEPEVVLMDVRLPDGSGLDGAARIMALRPGTAVIVMTAHADNLLALEAAQNGAAGFLLKDVRIAKIVAGVRRAVTGGLAVEPAVLEALMAQAMAEGRSGRATTAGAPDLSPPEEEVLRLLADGLDGADIAERLGVGDPEVAGIAASIRARLGARSNLEAVVRAARAGLFGPDHGSRARISNR